MPVSKVEQPLMGLEKVEMVPFLHNISIRGMLVANHNARPVPFSWQTPWKAGPSDGWLLYAVVESLKAVLRKICIFLIVEKVDSIRAGGEPRHWQAMDASRWPTLS